ASSFVPPAVAAIINPIIQQGGQLVQNITGSVGGFLANILNPFQNLAALFDQSPTRIFNLSVKELSDSTALITWQTNHPATSKVNFGPSYDYGHDWQSDAKVMVHQLTLTNLTPDTFYYYEVMSHGNTFAYDARHEF